MAAIGWWRGCRKVPYSVFANNGASAITKAVSRTTSSFIRAPFMAIATNTKARYDASSVSMTFNGSTLDTTAIDSLYGVGVASTNGIAYKTLTNHMACAHGFYGIRWGTPLLDQTLFISNGANSTATFYGYSLDGATGSTIQVSVLPLSSATYTVETTVGGSVVDTRTFTTSSAQQTYTLTVGDLGSLVSGLTTILVKITNNTGAAITFYVGVSGENYTSPNRAGVINASYNAYKVVMLDPATWDASDCLGSLYRSGSGTTSGTGTTYCGWVSLTNTTDNKVADALSLPNNFLYNAWDETTGTHYFDVEELCTKWTS